MKAPTPQDLDPQLNPNYNFENFINFLKIAKASALIHGRTFAIPEDVKGMAHQVLRHRIGLNYAAVADNVSVETVIDKIIDSVQTP
jgi:MoxR-like ATPase